MKHVAGILRQQLVLFPESLDEYIAADNPVRFIDAFVDSLDIAAVGFGHTSVAETGRPPYDPRDLLKLYIYGYLNRVRTSRRLEQECQRNVEVMWLLGKLAPDHKTIADFRKDNRRGFKEVFKAFCLLCRELDLFGKELTAENPPGQVSGLSQSDGGKWREPTLPDRSRQPLYAQKPPSACRLQRPNGGR